MSIYITGDTHGDFHRFYTKYFPERKHLSRTDCVIIAGDFGGVWGGEPEDAKRLDWLEALPFTTLFVDGNHENFDELYAYPVEEWHGGRIHRVRPHEGRTIFTMGGAKSTDVWDGILDPEEPGFEQRYWALRRSNAVFRVKHLSWWEQELPSREEYAEARRNLERVNYKVDYIITHCAPNSVQDQLSGGKHPHDPLTAFLEEIKNKTSFQSWMFGHYHADRRVNDQFLMLHEKIVQII